MKNDLLIIASGGGHTGFGVAIAEYLPFKPDFIIPEGDKFSEELVKPISRRIFYVKKGKEPNETNLSLIKNLPKIVAQSIRVPKYKVTVATGSNHSLIPAVIEKIKGSKLFAIESQDRFITKGKSIEILSHISKAVFLHWEEQKKLYKNGIVVGPIVGKPKYESKDGDYVLVTTGSMGFKRLFDTLISLNTKRKFIIQTGRIEPSIYKRKRQDWEFISFTTDIERLIANSSVVVTHQGKTAMEAVVMYRKPTIIVYNNEWIYATTKEDTKIYARVLGATFLDDPSTWESNEIILDAIEKAKKPNVFEPGTKKLVDILSNEI
ncbi:MAG: glycosyltransferase [Sulfolobus sp.]